MKRIREKAVRINILQRLVYTNRCPLCAKVIPIDKKLCTSCDSERHRVSPSEASRFLTVGKSFDRFTCPFYYEGKIRDGIQLFKYHGYKRFSEYFAEEMIKVIERDYSDEDPDFITCVPMTKRKESERDYNQCIFLLKYLADAFGYIKTPDLLIKITDTPSQAGLGEKERLKNLKGSFKANENYDLQGKTILLCDDVMTTGSTLNECAKTLKKAGAEKVICVTVATTKK